ncbi:MAG: hypothetical protein HFACDABA_00723 [Anaerolineales bacterium]|nr:hypothetical protein [Anaerolineales bacterium]
MRKISPLQLLLLLTLACSSIRLIRPPEPTPMTAPDSPTAAPSPTVIATISPTVEQVWIAYESGRYGYGISFPQSLKVNVVSDEYVEVGDAIVIGVMTTDPAALRGDGPVFESSSNVQIGLYPARLLTGYIGAIGGHIPQQFRMYVFQRADYYLTVTLYALGLHIMDGDASQIAPLDPNDVARFDRIVESIRFH